MAEDIDSVDALLTQLDEKRLEIAALTSRDFVFHLASDNWHDASA